MPPPKTTTPQQPKAETGLFPPCRELRQVGVQQDRLALGAQLHFSQRRRQRARFRRAAAANPAGSPSIRTAPSNTAIMWQRSSPPAGSGESKSQRSQTNLSHSTSRLTCGRSVGCGRCG